MRRAGGRAGDELWVTGTLGAAAAGLAWLESGRDRSATPDASACVARYERPSARVRLGRRVASSRSVTAAMDLSDGLADGARQIAAASGCGVVVDAAAIPIDPAARSVLEVVGRDPVQVALSGGEDYELLFAVPPRRRRAFQAAVLRSGGPIATCIGRLTADSTRAELLAPDGPVALATGFAHYAK